MHTVHSVPNFSTFKQQELKNKSTYGFEFPSDKQDALFLIWEKYKSVQYKRVNVSMYQDRCRGVMLMIECHKLMKLPLEVLFHAVSVYDRVLLESNESKMVEKCIENNIKIEIGDSDEEVGLEFYALGIACLYSCQKLGKVRSYGIGHWLKHLSCDNLTSLGFPYFHFSGDILRKYEAYIMKTMNYNLLSITIFDILLGIWTLKPSINEKQFYFAQYLCELSLFCQFDINNGANCENKFGSRETATTINQPSIQNENEQNSKKSKTGICLLDVGLAIVYLSSYFFGKGTYCHKSMIKKICSEMSKEENIKQLESKQNEHKILANQLFQIVLRAQSLPYTKQTVQKYKIYSNLSVSQYRFFAKTSVNAQLVRNNY